MVEVRIKCMYWGECFLFPPPHKAYTLEGDQALYMRFYSKPRDRYGGRCVLKADVDGAIQ